MKSGYLIIIALIVIPFIHLENARCDSESLTEYFGFGPLEILKLEGDITPPRLADINQDGLTDMLIINNRKSRIDLLLQKKDFSPTEDITFSSESEDINDIFGKEQSWRFRRITFALDVAAISLQVADLNKDGLPDLAFYSNEGVYIAWQKPANVEAQKPKEADGYVPEWTALHKIDIRDGLPDSDALCAGDLDHDGRTDLVLLTENGFYLIAQKEDGTPAEPVKYHSSATNPRRLFIADVNGDGLDDVVIHDGRNKDYPLLIRFQAGNGHLGPECRYGLPQPSAIGLCRLTDKTQQQFVSVAQSGGRVMLSTMAEAPSLQDYPVITYPLPPTEKSDGRDIVLADINGDGLEDVIISDSERAEFLVYMADARFALTTPERFPGLKNMSKMKAVEINAPGRDSILVMSPEEKLIALSGYENGRLHFPEPVAITGEPQTFDVADINNDGRPDLVYISRTKDDNKRYTYHLRTVVQVGCADAENGPECELKDIKDPPSDIHAGDIDLDGDMDILVVRSYGPVLLVQQENGVWTEQTKPGMNQGLLEKVKPSELSIVPLASENKPAVLVLNHNFARSLTFDPDKGWRVLDQYQAAYPDSNLSAAAVISHGGGPNPLLAFYDNAREKLALLSPQANGAYAIDRHIDIGSMQASKLLVGNVGGHSPTSLLLCGVRQIMRIPLTENIFSLQRIAEFEPTIKDGQLGEMAVGDINSDGCPDIALCEYNRHHVQILTFNAKGELAEGFVFKVYEQPQSESDDFTRGLDNKMRQPRSITLGDVTGDGKNDLILLVHDRIIIYPQS